MNLIACDCMLADHSLSSTSPHPQPVGLYLIALLVLAFSSTFSAVLPTETTAQHQYDGSVVMAGRRSRTPERDAIAASERLRSGELVRRKSRNMSLESVSSAATKELENDQLRLEKKNLEEEIGRIGKHLEEIRRDSSLVCA